jgi:hypothetical protein
MNMTSFGASKLMHLLSAFAIPRLLVTAIILGVLLDLVVLQRTESQDVAFLRQRADQIPLGREIEIRLSSTAVAPPKTCHDLGLEAPNINDDDDSGVESPLSFDDDDDDAISNNKDDATKKEGFSACLIVMDDNHFLIEWLAFHFHSLPLRRLIVAVDPKSQTSPSRIFDRYRTRGFMNITEWTNDEEYFPVQQEQERLRKQFPHDSHNDVVYTKELHDSRQRHFYAKCMETLQHENQTWTALIDSDEYLLMNANVKLEKNRIVPHRNHKTIFSTLNTAAKARSNNHTECENLGPLGQSIEASPCLLLPRLTFGTTPSSTDQISHHVPQGFVGTYFTTLQWRWHGGLDNFKVNRHPKGIIDVSRVQVPLIPEMTVEIHSPVRQYCNNLHTTNSKSSFVVHHYIGSWEQWGFRKDPRRTKHLYDQKTYNQGEEDHIRPWLHGFVNQVGLEMASLLLQGVGKVENEPS